MVRHFLTNEKRTSKGHSNAPRGWQGSVRVLGSEANVRRRQLANLIHNTSLGQRLRPLNLQERERVLGLPVGSTSHPEAKGVADVGRSLCLTGNAWSLAAFSVLLKPLLSAVMSDKMVECTVEAALPDTIEQAMRILQRQGRSAPDKTSLGGRSSRA